MFAATLGPAVMVGAHDGALLDDIARKCEGRRTCKSTTAFPVLLALASSFPLTTFRRTARGTHVVPSRMDEDVRGTGNLRQRGRTNRGATFDEFETQDTLNERVSNTWRKGGAEAEAALNSPNTLKSVDMRVQ